MELKLDIEYKQLLSLAKQLPESEKKKLFKELQKALDNDTPKKLSDKRRQLGKYKGQIQMSDDFNAPLDEFKNYM